MLHTILIILIIILVPSTIAYGIIKYRRAIKNVPDESNDIIGEEWKGEQTLKDKKEYIDTTLNQIKDDVIKKTTLDEVAVKKVEVQVEPKKVATPKVKTVETVKEEVKPKIIKPKVKKEVVAQKKAPAKKEKGK